MRTSEFAKPENSRIFYRDFNEFGVYDDTTAEQYVLQPITDTGVDTVAGDRAAGIRAVLQQLQRWREGSGLGLSMVYGFVKQSGGHISIYSRVGHGTSIKNHQLSWWFDGEPLKAVLKDSATFGMGLWDH